MRAEGAMVHFRTFLQAFTAGAIAVVGFSLAGAPGYGWLILAIFLVVWAVNTNDYAGESQCTCCHDDERRGNE